MVPFEASEAAQSAPSVNLDDIGGATAQPAPAVNDNAGEDEAPAAAAN
jgi:hypothetical protein